MALSYADWKNLIVEEKLGTPGGDTIIMNGKPICYALTHGSCRAVKALTGGVTKDYRLIVDGVVNHLEATGIIIVDETECDDEGWLGCIVKDADGGKIGQVGDRCTKYAGWGTGHVGTGRCKLHGGKVAAVTMAKMKHGRTAVVTKKRLASLIEKYAADPDPFNLARELATQRALLDEFLDIIVSVGDPKVLAQNIPDIMKSVDSVGKMVDRMVAIEQKYALTAGQVMYIQLTVVDILNTFIDDPARRESAANQLARRLGTDATIAQHPEFIMAASTVPERV